MNMASCLVDSFVLIKFVEDTEVDKKPSKVKITINQIQKNDIANSVEWLIVLVKTGFSGYNKGSIHMLDDIK